MTRNYNLFLFYGWFESFILQNNIFFYILLIYFGKTFLLQISSIFNLILFFFNSIYLEFFKFYIWNLFFFSLFFNWTFLLFFSHTIPEIQEPAAFVDPIRAGRAVRAFYQHHLLHGLPLVEPLPPLSMPLRELAIYYVQKYTQKCI